MKKIIVIMLVMCLIFTACAKSSSTTKLEQVSNTPIQNNIPTKAPTATPSPTAVPTETASPTHNPYYKSTDNPFDYSDHTDPNEKRYKTIVSDPSRLVDGKPVYALKEKVADWRNINLGGLSAKDEIFGYDIRSTNISNEDISSIDINDLSFNSDTVWPDKLPKGFDPEKILESNKNPGLGIRALHKEGITGKGVGIAIIDQILLQEHEQYKENLMYYERIHCSGDQADMHGAAVASLAVGKDTGVAPGSKLYYIASTFGHFGVQYEFDASIVADCILRVLEINKYLPEDEKIRVISISKGYTKDNKGYKEITDAIDKANKQNIFVITTSTYMYYDFTICGMSRDYLGDPEDFNSYYKPDWIEGLEDSYPFVYEDCILVPMDSRTHAACNGITDYEINHSGGFSWAVPWLAGFYALCCEVHPDITPNEFIKIVESTSVTTQVVRDGKKYEYGKIVNPAAVIAELQKQ